MTGPDERPWWRGSGQILMMASAGLAVAAAGVLTFGAEDSRLLRLGIVAALWAALLVAFGATRMRRDGDSGDDRTEELRTVYRLELEREIAARREHELTVERELRADMERREREDILALRGELQTLRDTLQHLLGGDVLVERVALRAESTRLLPLPDHPRAGAEGRGRIATAEVSQVPRSLTMSEWPAAEQDESPVRRRQARFAAEPSLDLGSQDRGVDRDTDRGSADRSPAGDATAGAAESRWDLWDARPVTSGSAAAVAPQPAAAPQRPSRHRDPGGRAEPVRTTGFPDREWSPATSGTAQSGTAQSGTASSWEPAVSSLLETGRQGRRHRAEPDPPAPAARQVPSPGRHGRVGEPGRDTRESSGRHTSPAPSPYGNGLPSSSGGRRRAAEEQRDVPAAGTRGGGSRSVGDLLAAYGEEPTPRRHRRRADN
jgi:hypothetical protein